MMLKLPELQVLYNQRRADFDSRKVTMVKLFCALAGAGGSAFPVDIDPSQSVGDLKEAIQGKKPRKITCDADELELYLAKRGDAWLTENEVRGMSITNGLKYLGAARAELDAVGLSEKDLAIRHR
ncbi:hypothetical protein Poli38472_003595 [Pythium oligandrum]|uniref:Crinkler effector protein N-terminal domain-containing protein n=1 Tax=Pythium oligandrum TaxID=41045 RepID=A0A8K1CM56_PYTOL|nr:hypothetical protein Poli38472_003595 [Pythium oligandrum]|eukprot:TMW65830.1 hypothetical protein Poli38472_003595 [Pythium oligandrum]